MDSWMDKINLHATAGLKYYPLNSFCFTWDPSLPGHVMHLLFSGELWTKKLFLGQKSSTTVNYWGKMHDYFTNWILQKKEGTKYFLLAKKQWANLAVTENKMVSLMYTKRSLWMCTSRCFCITSTSSPWATAEWSLGRWWPRHFPQLPSRSHIFWWELLCTTRCLTERVGCNPIDPQLCRFGPCLMSRHPPFSLRPLVFLYNLSKLSSIALIIVIILFIVFIVVALSSVQSPQTPAYASTQKSKKFLQASIFLRTILHIIIIRIRIYINMYRETHRKDSCMKGLGSARRRSWG